MENLIDNAPDTLLSKSTFDSLGNHHIETTINGRIKNRTSVHYYITEDGKYLIDSLDSGNSYQFYILKLTNSELELGIGTIRINKYKRLKE